MPFIDRRPVRGALPVALLLALTACAPPRAPSGSSTPSSAVRPTSRDEPARALSRDEPVRARNWDDYKLYAARRLMAANPSLTYDGAVPETLLAIPVLEIELNGDGSVRRITVQRQPSQARDTVQIAIDAVHRAAPFGQVSHLSKPWRYSEVFLFNDDRRFKPRVLDQ